MALYIDLALFAILVFSITRNLVRGFVKALRPFRRVVAVVLAWTMRMPAAKLIEVWLPTKAWETNIYNTIYGRFADKVNGIAGSSGKVTAESYDGVFGWLENVFSNIKDVCAQAVNNGVADVADTVARFVAVNSVGIIVGAIAFGGLLVIFWMLLFIAGVILERVCSGRNVLGYANRAIGGIMGAFVGVLITWGAALLIRLIVPDVVEQTVYVNWLCNEFALSLFFGAAQV